MESDGFFHTGIKTIYEVATARGFKVTVTKDHPLLKYEKDHLTWTKLEDLTVGDSIMMSNHRALTTWVGSGGTFEDGRALGNMDFNGQEVIAQIEKTSSEMQKGFLCGLMQCGSTVRDDDVLCYVHYDDVSVLPIVQRMLARFGIISSIDKHRVIVRCENIKLLYNFRRNNQCSKELEAMIQSRYNFIDDSELVHTAYDEVIDRPTGDGQYLRSEHLAPQTSETRKYINQQSDQFHDRIVSIIELEPDNVYDVTVADVHEFCANGLRISNCGEVLLKSNEFCNLSEIVCREFDTQESLRHKMKLATIIGTYQSSLTNYTYIDPKWKANQELERLLGVSLTGIYDCSTVRDSNVLSDLREYSVQINTEYAKRFGINPSSSITVTKPSGTVSQMVNASSGIHPRFSKYYIRRIRISATDPLLQLMKDQCYPCLPEVGQVEETANTFVLEFPVKSPDNAIVANQIEALDQLEFWKTVKLNYTEHNPSVTIYVKPDEWLKVGQWVWDNWDYITGLSFLPYSDHVYQLAPYEAITEEQYLALAAKVQKVDFSKLIYYEKSDTTDTKKEVACAGGVCEL
jgi:hypothetical protein